MYSLLHSATLPDTLIHKASKLGVLKIWDEDIFPLFLTQNKRPSLYEKQKYFCYYDVRVPIRNRVRLIIKNYPFLTNNVDTKYIQIVSLLVEIFHVADSPRKALIFGIIMEVMCYIRRDFFNMPKFIPTVNDKFTEFFKDLEGDIIFSSAYDLYLVLFEYEPIFKNLYYHIHERNEYQHGHNNIYIGVMENILNFPKEWFPTRVLHHLYWTKRSEKYLNKHKQLYINVVESISSYPPIKSLPNSVDYHFANDDFTSRL